ncbi:ATP-dependent DNA helicase Q1-like [Mya arenaria]|uniref:ATP-dependent DNA helicase Q1-like n=1 Tax=Mya arenaria TaxID=6604 RepID=UPI0022E96247|nr:ATP-dependent DNA helicase Q1-like [Mya arenaria]
MEDFEAELRTVRQELQTVECQLEDLLQRQTDLLDRETQLEAIITQANKTDSADNKWESNDFPWSGKLKETLKSVFKIGNLRPMQLQTMNVTMSGKDCILIMPTGGGKSLCFHLPALLSKGVTLVVSPLVSLMEDQVMSLQSYNVDATMLNAASDKNTVKQVQEAMVDHNASLKLLYVTPEKLAKSKRFMARLEKMYKAGRFARLVIDEVHCCSQWGHDFRPDYKFLGIMKRQFPEVPILGLTATATSTVLEDVKKILNIEHSTLFRASFNRPNLFYEVRAKSGVHKEVMDDIQKLIDTKFSKQSGIIYTFSKKESGEVTVDLQSRGIKAGCYHADLSAQERSRVHRAWIANHVHVVVATVAFGMGIDKPDVRFVIHHSLSKSMENLYQESGRAGRDEKRSHCIIYYRLQDVFRQSTMVMTEQTGLTNLYGIVAYCVDAKKCRRSVIARYFGEVWDSSQCNRMCDHCDNQCEVEKKDVTKLCSSVLQILDKASAADSKLTASKVLDAWQGKGPPINRVKETETGEDRSRLEVILTHMLLKQYLREDFHFTPYSTISYIIPGRKANLLCTGVDTVHIELKGARKSMQSVPSLNSKQSQNSSHSANSEQSQSEGRSSKPELVFVNKEKSAFTDMKFTSPNGSQDRQDARGSGEPQTNKPSGCERQKSGMKRSSSDKNSLKLKKKRVIVCDSDSDDLDFGNSSSSVEDKVKIVKRSSKGGDRVRKSDSTTTDLSQGAVVIDSDSDCGIVT